MYCGKCGAQLDVKYKQCPVCMEKVRFRIRMTEYNNLRKYSAKHPKIVWGDENIETARSVERYKARFGRKKRNEFIRTSNAVYVVLLLTLIGVILSAGIYERYVRAAGKQSDVVMTEENGNPGNGSGSISTPANATASDSTLKTQSEATPADADLADGTMTQNGSEQEHTESEKATPTDPQADKEHDVLAAQGVCQMSTDIIKTGKKKFREGYKRQLLNNKGTAVILGKPDTALKEEDIDVYGYIYNTLGEENLTVRYRDNGAVAYSIYIDEKNTVHVYASTAGNPSAYELYPNTDETYLSK